MKKITIENATIEVVLQDGNELSATNCPNGVISRKGNNTYKFEEAIRQPKSDKRNPKLIDGDFLSLTRKKNGKYSFNLKTVEFSPGMDGKAFANGVMKEILQGFKYMNV